MYIKVDENLEILEYHARGHFDGVSHVVVRTNKDKSSSIVCRGNLETCKDFCGIDVEANSMKEKIQEFKKKANRPNAWDNDVEKLLNACGGDLDLAVSLIQSGGAQKNDGMPLSKDYEGLKKLRQYLDIWESGKMIGGVHVSLQDIRECQDIYDKLSAGKEVEFINNIVRDILEKCNINVVNFGNGWKASVDKVKVLSDEQILKRINENIARQMAKRLEKPSVELLSRMEADARKENGFWY